MKNLSDEEIEGRRIAFDIGSNSGSFTEFFLTKAGFDKVIAVEANPALAEFLSQKFSASSVTVVNRAVSNSTDQLIDFYVCNADGISSADESWCTTGRFAINPYHQWTKTQIKTITIDDLVKQYGIPNHIKMDVEGYESVAIQGMTAAYCPIRFEWEEEKIDELEKSLNHLVSIGYHYFGIVVEHDNEFDDRPISYFDDINKLIVSLKTDILKQHQTNKFCPSNSVSAYYKFDYANEHGLMFWGMIWCFREIDSHFLFRNFVKKDNKDEDT